MPLTIIPLLSLGVGSLHDFVTRWDTPLEGSIRRMYLYLALV